jgi:hypothetical protein
LSVPKTIELGLKPVFGEMELFMIFYINNGKHSQSRVVRMASIFLSMVLTMPTVCSMCLLPLGCNADEPITWMFNAATVSNQLIARKQGPLSLCKRRTLKGWSTLVNKILHT